MANAGCLSFLTSIVAGVLSFFVSPWLGWAVLEVPLFFCMIVLIAVKRNRLRKYECLSPEANKLLQKYGHYYDRPHAATAFGHFTAALVTGVIALGVIDWYHQFYTGICIAIPTFFLCGHLTNNFLPSLIVRTDENISAHTEILTLRERLHEEKVRSIREMENSPEIMESSQQQSDSQP
jgi:hypothetical protein